MAFHNVPPNGFPDLPDVEELEAVEKDVKTLKTTTSEHGAAITALGTSKATKADIAPTFSAESNYAVGDLVYYEGTLYECTTEHEAAAWDAENFTAASIDDELSSLKSGLTVQTLTPVYNTDVVSNATVHAYRVGQMVFVEMEYTPVSGTISSNTAILSLLPAPISVFWSVNDGYTTLKIDSDGILKYWYPTETTTLTRRNYSFSYITT